MTQTAAAGGRIGAPIAAQMISLMAAGWIITLAVTVGIVLLLLRRFSPVRGGSA